MQFENHQLIKRNGYVQMKADIVDEARVICQHRGCSHFYGNMMLLIIFLMIAFQKD